MYVSVSKVHIETRLSIPSSFTLGRIDIDGLLREHIKIKLKRNKKKKNSYMDDVLVNIIYYVTREQQKRELLNRIKSGDDSYKGVKLEVRSGDIYFLRGIG